MYSIYSPRDLSDGAKGRGFKEETEGRHQRHCSYSSTKNNRIEGILFKFRFHSINVCWLDCLLLYNDRVTQMYSFWLLCKNSCVWPVLITNAPLLKLYKDTSLYSHNVCDCFLWDWHLKINEGKYINKCVQSGGFLLFNLINTIVE